MHVSWRLLLVALLVLAMPLQGFAAAGMVVCSWAHTGAAAAVVTAEPATAAPGTDAHAACAEAQAAASADGADVQPRSAGPSDPACSACAAYCAPGALLHALPQVPAEAAAPAHFAPDVPGVARVAASGPDRPPRSVRV